MDEDTVIPPEENVEVALPVSEPVDDVQDKTSKEEQVPLAALRRERLKRQELEIENRLLREQSAKAQPQEQNEDTQYESATKGDLGRTAKDVVRQVEERLWIKNNPDKYERVNELLPEFLKRRPNLASAIDTASNRYEEAWELMDKLTPKEQKQLRAPPAPKKEAPGSPTGSPKASALTEAVDVMSMSDADFARWRQSKRRTR